MLTVNVIKTQTQLIKKCFIFCAVIFVFIYSQVYFIFYVWTKIIKKESFYGFIYFIFFCSLYVAFDCVWLLVDFFIISLSFKILQFKASFANDVQKLLEIFDDSTHLSFLQGPYNMRHILSNIPKRKLFTDVIRFTGSIPEPSSFGGNIVPSINEINLLFSYFQSTAVFQFFIHKQ